MEQQFTAAIHTYLRDSLPVDFLTGQSITISVAFVICWLKPHRTNQRGMTSPTMEAREALSFHPTIKPIAMIADHMKYCSERRGIVLAPLFAVGEQS